MDLFLIRHGESTNNALTDNHITFEEAMDLFLIRHGESTNNALTDVSQRVADPELTAKGRVQAERVAAYLAGGLHLAPTERAEDRPFFDQLYCSPMIRTLHTAQAIEQAIESKSEIWVAIHEMGGIFLDHGGERGTVGYPGLTRAEIAARFPTSIPSAEVGEDGWWDAGKETDQQAQHRAIGVAADLRARAEEKDAHRLRDPRRLYEPVAFGLGQPSTGQRLLLRAREHGDYPRRARARRHHGYQIPQPHRAPARRVAATAVSKCVKGRTAMDHAALISDLGTFLREDQLLTSDEDCSVYAFDGTALLHQRPACVALPESREEVAQLLALCNQRGVPVVPRGSGTGLAGGSVPSQGGVALCLVRLNQILELDAANLVMVVQPGVLTQQIADAAQAAGLFYPPDPGSIKISTIGGNVANNSGGLRGLKYGVTRDYVMGLEVVLADGQVLETGNKCVKDVAGFTLKDLFIGSEGMLGVITKIALKLVPAPASKKTLLGLYDEMTQAAATVSAIIAHKIIPCTLEFLDRTTIECVEAHANIGLPTDCEAVLLMEVDGHPAQVAEQAAQIEAIAREGGARSVRLADSDAEAQQLAAARRTAFSALARLAPTVVLEDVTVPRSELATMVAYVQEVGQRHQVRVGTFGHFGDGNLHPTFLCDERDAEEMARVEKAMTEVFAHAVELGGTITGEHGVGLAKKPYLPGQLGPVGLEILKRVKTAFDPKGILNRGNMFD